MRQLVTCRQMKELDARTIQEKKMPSLVLMERAALAVTERILTWETPSGKVLVVCAMGNNGGDGIAIGRQLFLKGIPVELFLLGNPEKMTEETRHQYEIAKSYQVPFVNNPQWQEYTTIVDAIFGVGLQREVGGRFAETIGQMNGAKARKVAVDIPSGICGDRGQVLGTAFRADETVTFAFGKPGLFFYPGCLYAGRVTVADIGIYDEKAAPDMAVLELSDIPKWMPARQPGGNKGTFGKALLLVSKPGMAGAGYLCAAGCFAMGTGMVKLHTAAENRVIYQSLLPEAMVSCQEKETDLKLLEEDLHWCDVAAAGPGLGTGEEAEALLFHLLKSWKGPLVLDADALNLLARNKEWRTYLGPHCIVTPHLGEMSRLMDCSIEEIKKDPGKYAEEFARDTGAVCVLKDARSVIAARGECTYLNISGNEGMATAGSGDVLCGMITGLLAAGLPPVKAAPLGAYLHGLAGDEARRELGSRGMKAGDIIRGMQIFWKRNEEEEKWNHTAE